MRILTIIVSYNFERWMKRCLESLLHASQPTDILVIDNGSKDQTVDLVRRNYPSVRILSNGQNLGFGRANNLGMQIALQENYQAVFLLNQDAWIDADTLGVLASQSRMHPEYGILSPVHLNGKGEELDKGFASYIHVFDRQALTHDTCVVGAGFINAAFWFIPVATLRTVGGFSPLFYHYGEDKDYINRLHFHGLQAGYVPTVFGCHDREFRKSSKETFFQTEYMYLLSEAANINYSLARAFAYSVLAGIKKSLIILGHGKVGDSCRYLNLAWKLLVRGASICRIRKQTRQAHAHFLTPESSC